MEAWTQGASTRLEGLGRAVLFSILSAICFLHDIWEEMKTQSIWWESRARNKTRGSPEGCNVSFNSYLDHPPGIWTKKFPGPREFDSKFVPAPGHLTTPGIFKICTKYSTLEEHETCMKLLDFNPGPRAFSRLSLPSPGHSPHQICLAHRQEIFVDPQDARGMVRVGIEWDIRSVN